MDKVKILQLGEHESGSISMAGSEAFIPVEPPVFPGKRNRRLCFHLNKKETEIGIKADYFIGVSWLVHEQHALVVVPKVNSRLQAEADGLEEGNIEADGQIEETPTYYNSANEVPDIIFEVDYFGLLYQCLQNDFLQKEISNLVQIDWEAREIPIDVDKDFLTPLLIVKFLSVLKSIVRKGLMKSYYKVESNMDGRVKGKILVGQNIRDNLMKNRITKTWCRFEVFGVDDPDNRLLKKALEFCRAYIDNHSLLFNGEISFIQSLLGYCQPAFTEVGDSIDLRMVRDFKPNPMFGEYKEGLSLAKQILRRWSYSISQAASEVKSTPPYWIDMPKLFELYVYGELRKVFSKDQIHYQFSTHGNALDFLITDKEFPMVVDAKYKAYYANGVCHSDMRQVSGYARLKKVCKKLKPTNERELIDCLIIYPKPYVRDGSSFTISRESIKATNIPAYEGIYKLGIPLPARPKV